MRYLLDANGKYLVDANGIRLVEGTPSAVTLIFDSNIGPYQLWWYFDDTADPPVLESLIENQPRGKLYTLPPTPTGNDAPPSNWNHPNFNSSSWTTAETEASTDLPAGSGHPDVTVADVVPQNLYPCLWARAFVPPSPPSGYYFSAAYLYLGSLDARNTLTLNAPSTPITASQDVTALIQLDQENLLAIAFVAVPIDIGGAGGTETNGVILSALSFTLNGDGSLTLSCTSNIPVDPGSNSFFGVWIEVTRAYEGVYSILQVWQNDTSSFSITIAAADILSGQEYRFVYGEVSVRNPPVPHNTFGDWTTFSYTNRCAINVPRTDIEYRVLITMLPE